MSTIRTEFFSLHASAGAGMEVEISYRVCALALWDKIREHVGNIDDAGCDWYTDEHGAVFIGGQWGWCVTTDRTIGVLVDAMNVLTIGHLLKMQPDQALEAA